VRAGAIWLRLLTAYYGARRWSAHRAAMAAEIATILRQPRWLHSGLA
jgi:hypothetical protein